MTESEWLVSDDPDRMSEDLILGSRRKLRLFAVACCRRLPADVVDDDCRRCLDAAEASVDGRATAGDRRRAGDPMARLADRLEPAARAADARNDKSDRDYRVHHAAIACHTTAAVDPYYMRKAADLVQLAVTDRDAERRHQCALLRDIYGNPFRPPAFDPRWRTADALGLARGIYDGPAFDRLPLLADALMDAGCVDELVLGHCRSDGPHVRGCWVVDLVLGQE